MNEKPTLFGSYGLRTVLGSFGRRGVGTGVDTAKSEASFGKRTASPFQSLSLQRARLSYLRAELQALFNGEVSPENTPSFRRTEGDAPFLLIGETAVFLIDHVICHLAADPRTTGTETANKAARMLVGQTLADVERRLILQTLRHCRGNRMHAADMLGISLRTIRNKLRSYWRTSEQEGGQI